MATTRFTAASLIYGTLFLSISSVVGQTVTFSRTDIPAAAQRVFTADVNHDGIPDLVVFGPVLTVLLGKGDGTFQPPSVTAFSTFSTSTGFAVADFNLDGNPDVTNGTDVLLGNGDGTFQAPMPLPHVFSGDSSAAVGDFNGDGKPDLVMAGSGEVDVALGNGDGTFTTPSAYTVGNGIGSRTAQVAVSDLNGDGKLDIVAINSQNPSSISVLMGHGDGTFATAVSYLTVNPVPTCIAIGDVNGDGKLDVIVAGADVEVFLGRGDGTFQSPSSITLPPYIQSIAIGDVTGDGKPDIVAARGQGNLNTYFALVLPGNGDGTFGMPSAFAVDVSPQSVALADFNRDGKLDVVTANQGDVSVLLNTGFSPVTVAVNPVSPNSGSGSNQTFTLQYTDFTGASNLSKAWVWFNSSTSLADSSNSCLIYYDVQPNTTSIYLEDDNGSSFQGGFLGVSTSTFTAHNGQCSFKSSDVTVSLNGNTLTLNLPLTFSSPFAGPKTVYMMAVDAGGPTTGWQSRGTWTVPAVSGIPATVSVTPSSGSMSGQAFALQYLDSAGAANLQTVWVYFNATLNTNASNSCLLYYNIAANKVNLLNDAGAAWMVSTVGAATILQNSQCSLNVGGTYVERNGNTLTLHLTMFFQPTYAGAKNIYMYAADLSGTNSGWQQLGTWTVPAGFGVAQTVSVMPSSGSVASQSFALQYIDSAGVASFQTVWVYFNATLNTNASNSCLLYYSVTANQINLLNDSGTAWLSAAPGAVTTLQNSQCSLNVAGTSVMPNGNTLTLTLNLPMTFQPAYAGVKNIYMYALDVSGENSGWQQQGTWTVPGGIVTVTANSVTPSSGSLASQTFALQYSDTAGAASLELAYAYFNATLASSASNSCFLYYNVAANQINLMNDAGAAWMTATPGSATTLQNSQCSLNVATTSVALNGNTLTLNLAMTFKPAYAGAKNIYIYAADVSGPNSGWQQQGTWTVPGGIVTVTANSVTPNSGSLASQTFALQYSDTAGAASLRLAYAYFNATLASSASNSCFLYYNVAANQINLMNDAGAAWMAATPGAATTLQNSQCSLNVAATSVALNGNTLTLNLAMTFQPAFAGAKNIYLYAADISGPNSGWQQPGTWTVPSGVVTVTANSVMPSSGSLASQTFALQYSDTAGAASLQLGYAYFNATLASSAANSCFLYYNVGANQINLLNDAGTAWMTATPGAATTLQNSQCSLNVAATSVAVNGNTLTLNLAMTFLHAYAGAKNIYMYAADVSGPNSGWQQPGMWTVP